MIVQCRFKTEKEFRNEFGQEWYNKVDWNYNYMNYLFGTNVNFPEDKINDNNYRLYIEDITHIRSNGTWSINNKMIKLIVPNYKPKKFIREI